MRQQPRQAEQEGDSFFARLTWFALEGHDGLDVGLFTGAGTALGVHQPDVVSW